MYINYAGFFLCSFLLKDKKLRKILLNTFVIASIFLIIIRRVTLSGERFTNIFVNSQIDITVFAQFNHYGYYLMMSLITCLGLLTLYGIYSLVKKVDRKQVFTAIAIFVILSCVTIKDNENLAFSNLSQFALN